MLTYRSGRETLDYTVSEGTTCWILVSRTRPRGWREAYTKQIEMKNKAGGRRGQARPGTPVSPDRGPPAGGTPGPEPHFRPPVADPSPEPQEQTRPWPFSRVRGEFGASRRWGEAWGGPVRSSPGSSRTRGHRSQPEPLGAEGLLTSGGKNNESARARRQLPVPPGAWSPGQQGSGTRAAPGGWPAPGPPGRLGSVLSSFGEQCGSMPAGGVARGPRGWTQSPGSGATATRADAGLSNQ